MNTPFVFSNSSYPVIMSYKGQKDYTSCKVQTSKDNATADLLYTSHRISNTQSQ